MGRRRPRRTIRKRKLRRVRSNTVHSFIRTAETIYNLTYGVPLYRGDQFQLNLTPSSTEFTNLYDQYRIKGVKRTFIYSQTGADTTGAIGPYGPAGAPMLYMVRDYDDAATPSAVSEFLQRPYCTIRRLTGITKTFIRPKMAGSVYNGGTTAYGPKSGWIDVGYPDVPHYAIKWIVIPQGGSTTALGTIYGTLRVIDRYYLQFKNPR